MRELLQDCQRRETWYEWDLEEIDEYGDVIDHHHADKLSEFPLDFDPESYVLVLVRDSGCEADGLDDRQWAYTALDDNLDWILPSHFDGGNLVPKKYHAELARWQKAK